MMSLLKKAYQQLIKELIDILLKVRANIKDGSDCTWTYYETPEQMREEIDKYILELENTDTQSLEEINAHFAPTSAYQEHSMSNRWTNEYYKLSTKFDKIYKAFKKSSL